MKLRLTSTKRWEHVICVLIKAHLSQCIKSWVENTFIIALEIRFGMAAKNSVSYPKNWQCIHTKHTNKKE